MSLIAVVDGPTNITSDLWQSSANSVFSDKKPYPGWMAWQPERFAMSIIASFLR
jgi:hypothetical protein